MESVVLVVASFRRLERQLVKEILRRLAPTAVRLEHEGHKRKFGLVLPVLETLLLLALVGVFPGPPVQDVAWGWRVDDGDVEKTTRLLQSTVHCNVSAHFGLWIFLASGE